MTRLDKVVLTALILRVAMVLPVEGNANGQGINIRTSEEKQTGMIQGLYSDEASQLRYTNAGHLAPMIVRKGAVLRLPGDGFPVGLFPGVQI